MRWISLSVLLALGPNQKVLCLACQALAKRIGGIEET
jgi:hypothetical protein